MIFDVRPSKLGTEGDGFFHEQDPWLNDFGPQWAEQGRMRDVSKRRFKA